MKSFLEFIEKNNFTKSLFLGLCISLILLALKWWGTFETLDLNRIDNMYTLRDDPQNNKDITVWVIDDDDLENSRWPWSWEKYNHIANSLNDYDAEQAIFMFDYFAEMGSLTLNDEDAQNYKDTINAELEKGKDYLDIIQKVAPDHNQKFLENLKKSDKFVFSQFFVIPDDQSDRDQLLARSNKRINRFNKKKLESIRLIQKFGQKWSSPGQLLQAIDVVPITRELAEVAHSVSFRRITPDSDGVVRRTPTLVYYNGHIYFSQGVVSFAKANNCPIENIEVIPGKHLRFKGVKSKKDPTQDVCIPIDEKGIMYINWTAKAQIRSFQTIPLALVRKYLLHDLSKKLIKDVEDWDLDLVKQFNELFMQKIVNSGLLKKEDAIDQYDTTILVWLADTMLNNEALEEPIAAIHHIIGEGFKNEETAHLINIYPIAEAMTLNRQLAERLKSGKPTPTFESLLKSLNIKGNLVSRLHLNALGEKLQKEYEGILDSDILEVLIDKGIYTIAKDLYDDYEDHILAIHHTDLPYSEYESMVSQKTGLSIDQLRTFNIQYLYQLVHDNLKLYQENFNQTLHFAQKDMIDEVRPLYFLEPSNLTIRHEEVSTSLSHITGQNIYIGLTATGLNALNPTPYSQRDMMAGLSPAVYNTISQEFFIEELAWTEIIFILLYAVGIIYLSYRLPIYLSFPLFLALGFGHFFMGLYLFSNYGKIIATNTPCLSLILGFLLSMLYQYWEQQRERKKIRGMFSAMVSPEVLKIMEEDPDKFNLQGEKVYASMFSSDVSGFTSISEGVTAQELALILNLYLTPMSNLVMIYDGYVEKYEGDAIKADFGMPIQDSGHAWKACYSAILQQEELCVVQRMLQLKYGVEISARMGVNTGDVSAGNMGSENKMQYCAIGHEVAMAEELEPSNKMWETWIAISEETRRMSEDRLELRLLDNVIYEHDEVIPVYEVLGWKKEPFLEFWKDKPIPNLIIEGWQKIIPEKILAYIEYYQQRHFSENEFSKTMMESFLSLEEKSITYVKLNDKIDVYHLDQNLKQLAEELASFGKKVDESKFVEVDIVELKRMKESVENAEEPWLQFITKHLFQLKMHAHLVNQISSELDQNQIDSLTNRIDTYEKNCNCYIKRNGFPTENDKYGQLFKKHLVEILKNPDQGLNEDKISEIQKEIQSINQDIKSEMDKFAAKAKTLAPQYHEFITEHGLVPAEKKKVVDIFTEGRKLYLNKKWDEAEVKFKEGLALVANDGPCQTFINRCQTYKQNPPNGSWNGNWPADW